MAASSCPKCSSTEFETAIREPAGSKFKLQFVQCGRCGAVVGVQPYYNTAHLLGKIAKKLGIDILD